MAKDKKNKKKDVKKANSGASVKLKALAENPLIADIVTATLIGAAAALKDSNKARQLAVSAGKELETAAKQGAVKGNVLWQLALDVGRKSLDALAAEAAPKTKSRAKPKPKPKPKPKSKPKARPKAAAAAKRK